MTSFVAVLSFGHIRVGVEGGVHGPPNAANSHHTFIGQFYGVFCFVGNNARHM